MMMNLLIMNCLNNLLFISFKHPMSLGAILLSQTIIISLLTGLFYSNFWFSYMLFIVMIGGMLVLFTYMTSVASNEKFKFNKYLALPIMFMPILSFIMNYLMDPAIPMKLTKLLDYSSKLPLIQQNLPLMNYMNYPNMLFMITLMFYLLYTLIAVVKLTDPKQGPLRQKF